MRSIIQTDDKCFLCHMAYGTDTHHIFGAANRKFSEEDGLKIRVCRTCHDAIHFSDRSGEIQQKLHQLGQMKWEDKYGSREEFMKRYGRNWL